MHVFLGITGASGAPYAARLLEALAAADCEIGVAASSAGIEVLATELYGNARLSRDETIARLLEHAPNATLYDPNDWKAPYASGSAKVDAYVICPCSMGTLGTIASGAMQNLIHRAASVALKEERRLVLMPRETPLSVIHLRNMLTLREAGATILFLAPGFYNGAETVDDLVDFVVGARARPARAREHAHEAMGAVNVETGTLPADGRPEDVRPHRAGVRRDEPRHDCGARPALAADHDRRDRARAATGCSTPAAAPAISRSPRAHAARDASGSTSPSAMLERARRKEPAIEWVQGDMLALPFDDASFDAATVGFGVRNVDGSRSGAARAAARAARRRPRSAFSRSRRRAARSRRSTACGSTRSCPLLGKVLPGGSAYTYLPASVRRFPPPDELAALLERCGFATSRYRTFAGGIVALHVGDG